MNLEEMLCKLGFHKWEKRTLNADDGYDKICKRCKKRKIEILAIFESDLRKLIERGKDES